MNSFLCLLNYSPQWIGPWLHFPKEVFLEETNLENGTISWKHSRAGWLCFQYRNKTGLFLKDNTFLNRMLITFEAHLCGSLSTLAVTNPGMGKQNRTQLHQHTISMWNQNCPLLMKILRDSNQRNGERKNCPNMVIILTQGLSIAQSFPGTSLSIKSAKSDP